MLEDLERPTDANEEISQIAPAGAATTGLQPGAGFAAWRYGELA